MELPFIKFIRRTQLTRYEEPEQDLRFRVKNSDLWIGNRLVTMGIRFTDDGLARMIGLASLDPDEPARGQNQLDPTQERCFMWSEDLGIHKITWETRTYPKASWDEPTTIYPSEVQLEDGRERNVTEGQVTFHLKPRRARDQGQDLLLYRISFVSGLPFFGVQCDMPSPQAIQAWTETEGVTWDPVQRLRFPMRARHYQMTAIRLEPNTDLHDQPVRSETFLLNPRVGSQAEGEHFLLEDLSDGHRMLFVREAMPAETLQELDAEVTDRNMRWRVEVEEERGQWRYQAQLHLIGRAIDLDEASYVFGDRIVVGVGGDDLRTRYVDRLRWELFRSDDHGFDPERSHALMLRRPRTAGPSSALRPEAGRRRHELWLQTLEQDLEAAHDLELDLFEVDESIGEAALETLVKRAHAHEMILRLCLIPNAKEDYRHLEEDLERILRYRDQWGIDHFRFQDVNFESEAGYGRYTAFLHQLMQEKIHFAQDTREGMRPWLSDKPGWGSLRLELRTAEAGTYYPHTTLKKLWELSGVMPAERLELAVEDPHAYVANYRNDPLGLPQAPIDYLFFAVCAASPVMQFKPETLGTEDRQRLKEAIRLYRKLRPALQRLRVRPVGSMPNGRSVTGFAFIDDWDRVLYLLVLKEGGRDGHFRWLLEGLSYTFRSRCLMSNTPLRPALEISYPEDLGRRDEKDKAEVSGNLGPLRFRYAFYGFEPLG